MKHFIKHIKKYFLLLHIINYLLLFILNIINKNNILIFKFLTN